MKRHVADEHFMDNWKFLEMNLARVNFDFPDYRPNIKMIRCLWSIRGPLKMYSEIPKHFFSFILFWCILKFIKANLTYICIIIVSYTAIKITLQLVFFMTCHSFWITKSTKNTLFFLLQMKISSLRLYNFK